jgi:monovalent cation:H+ antiporter-2, CPA2 family
VPAVAPRAAVARGWPADPSVQSPSGLQDLLIILGLGVAVVLATHQLRIPPIVGFLITGVLCGPYGFRLIENRDQVEALAEVGVVLLLFTVGIEFSLQQLVRLRAFLFAGGGLQVGLTIACTFALARAAGAEWRVALFLGMLCALSSTAIVLRLLADRGEIDSPHGQAALGILIFQDLCVVPMVLLTPFLAGGAVRLESLGWVAAKALLFVGGAVLAARHVVPRLLHYVVATRKREVFLLAVILLCMGTAWASSQVGLSLALGAFIAGLVIAESEYSHQALGEILPLREVFNSLFFVSIGMLFDVRTVLRAPLLVAAALAGVVALKALVSAISVLALGQSLRVAVIAALAISQIGEFSFVLSRYGLDSGLLDAALYQAFLAAAVGSMALTPLALAAGPRLAGRFERLAPTRLSAGRASPPVLHEGAPLEDHVIIVGYGVNGRNLARVLGRVGIPFVVVEMNPFAVRAERRRGRPIIYGDATRPEILDHAGIAKARVLVLAISDAAATRRAVDLAHRLNPRVHILVRSRYIHEMEPLFALGTNEVVPEEFETSVEIFARVLRRYLVPRDVIDAQIREIRRDGYEMFRTISAAHAPATGIERILADLSFEVYRAEAGSHVAGRSLLESGLRETSGATVVAVQRADGTILVNPAGEDAIGVGDLVLVLGRHEQISRAAPLFRVASSDTAAAARPTGAAAK